MRHSTDADGNHNRPTGEVFPLPVIAMLGTTPTEATHVEGSKFPAAIASPEAIAAADTRIQSVIIRACRGARVVNTGSVWIGFSGVNDAQLYEMLPGETLSFTAPPGKCIDLSNIFVDSVTLGDGVIFLGVL